MQSHRGIRFVIFAALAIPLYAVDGVALINQSAALAGNVTPGDTPGFPVTISVSGSYKLPGNLTIPDANTDGIVITANDVTIDLNGFSIIGPTVCSGAPTVISCIPTGSGRGIANSPTLSDSARNRVFNGNVRGMGSAGIVLSGVTDTFVERVVATSNGGIGITAIVVNASSATQNGADGIDGDKVEDSRAEANFGSGIIAFQLARSQQRS